MVAACVYFKYFPLQYMHIKTVSASIFTSTFTLHIIFCNKPITTKHLFCYIFIRLGTATVSRPGFVWLLCNKQRIPTP